MDPAKSQLSEKSHKGEEKPAGTEIGGREFGQVIEPMQAQMASENEGLTEKPAAKPAKGPVKRGKRNPKAA